VSKWIASAGADFYELSIQALVYLWRKCIAGDGDYVERNCFVAENLPNPTALLCTLYLL
jgi:hypothetical protein